MNKKITITLIVVLSVLSLSLIGFMIAVMTGALNISGNFGISNLGTSTKLAYEKSYTSFNNIDIDASAAEIYFYSTDKKELTLKVFDDKNNTKTSDSNGKINIVNTTENGFLTSVKKAKIELYLPKSYSDSINITDNLGDIKIESLPNADIKVKENAGNVEVKECKNAEIENDLGNIFVGKVNDLKATEHSGNIEAGEVKNAVVNNDLGNILISSVNGYMDVYNNCGNIEIKSAVLTKSSRVENDLGAIKIGSTNKIFVDAHCDMGNVNVKSTYRDSDITLRLNNNMGDITVDN